MEPQGILPKRPWYKKKRYILASLVLGLFIIAGLANGNSSVQLNTQVASPLSSQYVTSKSAPVQSNSSGLSNSNYYVNTSGNTVHSPAYSNSIPVGASAQCRDGTYSFSQSRRGTCSHHGGVGRWL